jgi:hypothetical protein
MVWSVMLHIVCPSLTACTRAAGGVDAARVAVGRQTPDAFF